MIKTTKDINLAQLDKELGAYGLSSSPLDTGELLIVIPEHSPVTVEQLEKAIGLHQAIDDVAVAELKKAELYTKLGITADEAKLLLS